MLRNKRHWIYLKPVAQKLSWRVHPVRSYSSSYHDRCNMEWSHGGYLPVGKINGQILLLSKGMLEGLAFVCVPELLFCWSSPKAVKSQDIISPERSTIYRTLCIEQLKMLVKWATSSSSAAWSSSSIASQEDNQGGRARPCASAEAKPSNSISLRSPCNCLTCVVVQGV